MASDHTGSFTRSQDPFQDHHMIPQPAHWPNRRTKKNQWIQTVSWVFIFPHSLLGAGTIAEERDSIAEPLYALLSEVFDMRGVFRWLRKTLVTFVQITYGRTINRFYIFLYTYLLTDVSLIYYFSLLHSLIKWFIKLSSMLIETGIIFQADQRDGIVVVLWEYAALLHQCGAKVVVAGRPALRKHLQ